MDDNEEDYEQEEFENIGQVDPAMIAERQRRVGCVQGYPGEQSLEVDGQEYYEEDEYEEDAEDEQESDSHAIKNQNYRDQIEQLKANVMAIKGGKNKGKA